jgi:hypothetical protein
MSESAKFFRRDANPTKPVWRNLSAKKPLAA